MGMSSSQARLLNLTARMHQIEYKAAKLEAMKLQMANESSRVYETYLEAIDKSKIQIKRLSTDGTIDYVDATYNTLLNDGYRLSSSGAIAVTQADIDFFNADADKNAVEFACLKSGFAVKNGNFLTLANDSTQYLAFDANGLKSLAAAGKNIVLMDDIQVSSSLGTLTTSLNGNGHTIKATGSSGIFSTINGGSVNNLNIDANIKGYSIVGALANTTNGNVSLENISVSGKIESTSNTGGLIGQTNSGTITINNIYTGVNIKSSGGAGGVVGVNNNGTLDVDNITGNVTINSKDPSGGILGNTWGPEINNISNCNIGADITVTNGVAGGIVGMAWDSIYADNCYVTGNISSNSNNSYASAGGIYGGWGANKSKGNGQAGISNCYTDVTLTASASKPSDESTGDIGGLIWSTNGTHYIKNCASSNGTTFADLESTNHNMTFTEAANINSVKQNVQNVGNTQNPTTEYNPEIAPNYTNYLEIGQAIASGNYFLVDGKEDNNEWLTNMVNNGSIILEKPDNDGNYYDTSVATDTNLQEVSDESVIRKAEAKYEADMKKIDNKDRKYDTDLAALDTERNALKEEMETLKTVAKENVERTFKLFG